jgi:hypothetical protein
MHFRGLITVSDIANMTATATAAAAAEDRSTLTEEVP